MPTPTKGPRLGGGPAHQRLILSNLATALFEHDRITTTQTKARRLRPYAERLITFAKRGDLHSRRRVMTVIRDKSVVHKLFTQIAPDVEQRPGGYTRITKIAPRKGDNAPMAVIELVREPFSPKQATVKEAEAAAKRAAAPVATQETPDPEPRTGTTEAEAPAGGDAEAPDETSETSETSETHETYEAGASQADAPAGGDEQPLAPAEGVDSEGTTQAEAPASDNTDSGSSDVDVSDGATEAQAPASEGEDKA